MNKAYRRISVRVTPHQEQVLSELSQATDTSYSLLIRTILGDWIAKNEEYLNKIIDKNSHANNK